MKKLQLHVTGLLCLILLAGCAPKTPQEAAQAFWNAVSSNDADGVVEYSTLTDAKAYDGFSRDWKGMTPSWGKVVIDGQEASIVTQLSGPDKSDDNSLKFVTYLVRQDDQWKVDYEHTSDEISSSATLQNIFGQLGKLGEKISSQFQSASEDLNAQMEHMAEQVRQLSDSLSQQASDSIAHYSEQLRRDLNEMSRSIERALKEKDGTVSDDDRRTLNEAVTDLNQSSEELSDPSATAIADSGKTVVATRQRLAAVDDETFARYKEQWEEWGAAVQADMQKLVKQLADRK